MKRLPIVLSVAVLTLPLLAVAPASAATGSTAACSFSLTLTLAPGISGTSSGTSTVTTHGETGTITCAGTVAGKGIDGMGTIGEEGTVDGTCALGSGSTTFSMTIPTASGPVTMRTPATFIYGPGLGYGGGDAFHGSFQFLPTAGDCITTPVTQIVVLGQHILTT
jgi:hypothetical protein